MVKADYYSLPSGLVYTDKEELPNVQANSKGKDMVEIEIRLGELE